MFFYKKYEKYRILKKINGNKDKHKLIKVLHMDIVIVLKIHRNAAVRRGPVYKEQSCSDQCPVCIGLAIFLSAKSANLVLIFSFI